MAERTGRGGLGRGVPRAASERTRRRFVRRRWARRWLAWRPVLAVAALLAAVAAGVWAVYFSTLLDVEEVQVDGTGLLAPEEVRTAVGAVEGDPLARVDLTRVEARVAALAPVLEAEATRGWPDTLRVVVTEREAIAVVEVGGALRGMDDQGVLFREYARPPGDLPRVLMPTGTSSEAMLEAARVIRALPGDLAARVEHVEVATVDAISLALRGGRSIVWGSAEESAAKAEVLDALLAAVQAEVYDVSVPGQPTTRG